MSDIIKSGAVGLIFFLLAMVFLGLNFTAPDHLDATLGLGTEPGGALLSAAPFGLIAGLEIAALCYLINYALSKLAHFNFSWIYVVALGCCTFILFIPFWYGLIPMIFGFFMIWPLLHVAAWAVLISILFLRKHILV